MKKLIIILTVLVSLAFAGYYQYGLFTDINYFKAKADIKDGNVQILTFGLSVPDSALNIVAKNYGFKYNRIADCVVTQRFINQVDSYNSAVIDYLDKRYGDDWFKEFEKEVDKIYLIKN